ncbi:MAG: hypothetical protein EWM51_04320 [Treponema sp.]|nr:MAG: hypothetical protein EWM51_04320 [Treponema sp.]
MGDKIQCYHCGRWIEGTPIWGSGLLPQVYCSRKCCDQAEPEHTYEYKQAQRDKASADLAARDALAAEKQQLESERRQQADAVANLVTQQIELRKLDERRLEAEEAARQESSRREEERLALERAAHHERKLQRERMENEARQEQENRETRKLKIFFGALRTGDRDTIETLLNSLEVDPDVLYAGKTPLIVSAETENEELFALLLSKGANVDFSLDAALKTQNLTAVRRLILEPFQISIPTVLESFWSGNAELADILDSTIDLGQVAGLKGVYTRAKREGNERVIEAFESTSIDLEPWDAEYEQIANDALAKKRQLQEEQKIRDDARRKDEELKQIQRAAYIRFRNKGLHIALFLLGVSGLWLLFPVVSWSRTASIWRLVPVIVLPQICILVCCRGKAIKDQFLVVGLLPLCVSFVLNLFSGVLVPIFGPYQAVFPKNLPYDLPLALTFIVCGVIGIHKIRIGDDS